MNNGKILFRLIVSCLYVGLAVVSYVWDFTVMLMLLGIPWSIPLMMLSGLIVHMTVDGKEILTVGSIIGVMLNLSLYYLIVCRKQDNKL